MNLKKLLVKLKIRVLGKHKSKGGKRKKKGLLTACSPCCTEKYADMYGVSKLINKVTVKKNYHSIG